MAGNRAVDRIWELDFLRGVALIMMVYFHLIYDLKVYYNYPINYETNANYYIGKISAVIFILVAGICSSLSKSNFRRGLRVLGASMLVTAATFIYNPADFILFGILQFLGVNMLLAAYLRRLNKYMLLVIGTILLVSSCLILQIKVNNDYLMIFGIVSDNFSSPDYYPLIPWSGVFLYGIALGKELYSFKRSLAGVKPRGRIISAAGRYSLPVYLIHQPVLMLVLKLILV